MRSGWPHSGDGRGTTSASQGHAPFGPEVSWPNGYSDVEYARGDYRHASQQAVPLPGAGQNSHPYTTFDGPGYGDDGYQDPGYQGPAAQDAGIAGTRTVQGYVEPGRGRPNYPPPGYAGSSHLPPTAANPRPGYAGSSYASSGEIEMAYPPSATAGHGSHLYQQPWDYEQPLRYDGEEDSHLDHGRDDRAGHYQASGYDPAAYNGSEHSRPGIDGPGYDLSGIIGTSDFESVGYDEPRYGRLSYDDPRYEDGPRRPQPGQRFDETRTDMRRFDETRLDNLWLPGEDVRREAGPTGYGSGGTGPTRSRSASPAVGGRGRGVRSAETRYDMRALVEPGDNTRTDLRRFDETRLDNSRPLNPTRAQQRLTGALALPPAPAKPRGWARDTSLDRLADPDLADEPVPAAYTRTLDRPSSDSMPFELPAQQDDETASRRSIGKRRGRSSDRRQWIALGGIAVVAAGLIGGVLMKYVFNGPSGPAHSVAAPQTVDGFTRSANLEKQTGIANEAASWVKSSAGQASAVKYGVYQIGASSAGGTPTQMFMFVGGKLTGTDPGASIANFEQKYPGAVTTSPGSLGGQEACTQTTNNGQSVSLCVWFDNDTFGAMMSPTMTTGKLAATMNTVRPSLELLQP